MCVFTVSGRETERRRIDIEGGEREGEKRDFWVGGGGFCGYCVLNSR